MRQGTDTDDSVRQREMEEVDEMDTRCALKSTKTMGEKKKKKTDLV